jgi:hypothetical protein
LNRFGSGWIFAPGVGLPVIEALSDDSGSICGWKISAVASSGTLPRGKTLQPVV